jgi:hypothetical protein|tara:strand:- start:107 stop:334 length:228 start_codon:yes stop_codon:yes gene_type:complete
MSLLINTKQAAELLFGQTTETARKRAMRFADSNNIEPIRDGRYIYFRREDIENITRQKTEAPRVHVGANGLSLGN